MTKPNWESLYDEWAKSEDPDNFAVDHKNEFVELHLKRGSHLVTNEDELLQAFKSIQASSPGDDIFLQSGETTFNQLRSVLTLGLLNKHYLPNDKHFELWIRNAFPDNDPISQLCRDCAYALRKALIISEEPDKTEA